MAATAQARKKELGAFYTPTEIAQRLVEWAVRSPSDTVIDPSFGGYVFVDLARKRLMRLGADADLVGRQVCGIDVDPAALRAAREQDALRDCRLIHADFFKVRPDNSLRFTANVGNPPYVRYQAWNGGAQRAHHLAEKMGVRLTRLASTWAPFILHGCSFLEEGGRLAQVLPAEMLHSQYARPVLDYLASSFKSVIVAVFEERVFPGALEEVLLLFADGYGEGPARGITLVTSRNLSELTAERIDGAGRGYLDPDIPLLRLLARETQRLYERLSIDPRVKRLGGHATVDIGVVTGANDFFIRSRDEFEAEGYDPRLFRAAISKATDISGARFSGHDLADLERRGRRTALLDVSKGDAESLATVERLIATGRKARLHKRFKCRTREPWYEVPIPKSGVPDAFLTYMSNAFPRLVLNSARALSTNTIHNVSLLYGGSPAATCAAFYNSLTMLSAELVGRSYGGGILKLEPTEAEKLLLPPFTAALGKQLSAVDRSIRRGDLDVALDLIDPLVLGPLGLTARDIARLRAARHSLRQRRATRSSRQSGKAQEDTSKRNRRSKATRRGPSRG